MKTIMQPFIALRNRKEPSSSKVQASEKLRLQKLNDTTLTLVDAMLLGSSSDEETGDTPLRRAANRRAKAILRSINEPHRGSPTTNLDGASSGYSLPVRFRIRAFH